MRHRFQIGDVAYWLTSEDLWSPLVIEVSPPFHVSIYGAVEKAPSKPLFSRRHSPVRAGT